jgi:DHA1 family multidrug resistance protein-like MFS transporter
MVASPVTFELVPLFAKGELLGAYYGFNGYAMAFGGALSACLGGWIYDLGIAWKNPNLPWQICLGLGIVVFCGLNYFEAASKDSLQQKKLEFAA